MNLPEKFDFTIAVTSDARKYTATKGRETYHVTWKGCNTGAYYSISSVAESVLKGTWKIISSTPITTTLLEKLKQFTLDTGASVFIDDGQYEVYFDASRITVCGNPAKAASDEELEKIVDAILTLNKAVSGNA
jgi:hypothetical protein